MENKKHIYISFYISLLFHFILFYSIFFIKEIISLPYPIPQNEKIITIKLINKNEKEEENKIISKLNKEVEQIKNKYKETKSSFVNVKNIKDTIVQENKIPSKKQPLPYPISKKENIYENENLKNLSKEQQNYLEENYNEIVTIIYKNLIYPPISGRLGHQGTVYLNFDLNIDGNIENINIEQSSKYKELDYSAMEVIEYSKKEFKKPKEKVNIKLKINYKL